MVNFWARTERVARAMTQDEKEQRDVVRADWVDSARIAVAPTLDDETRERRAMRQRAVAYADLRKERQRQAMARHVATSKSRQAHHHLEGGGTV
jgi:hypothetical protein